MSVKVNLDGIDELREALHALPQALATQAAYIVREAANRAGSETRNAYPIRQTNLHPGPHRNTPFYPPGNLHNHVTVTNASTKVTAAYKVKSLAPHAWLFEHGSANRYTNSGANRGRMPKANIAERMIPKVQRIRAQMVKALIEFVREQGFVVNE